MVSVWAIAIGFIFLNSIFVAAEFATVAARTTVIRKSALSGNGLASHLLPILETPRRLDEYIATCQIAITFSSLILGAYTETHFGPIWAAFLVNVFKFDHTLAARIPVSSGRFYFSANSHWRTPAQIDITAAL
ncbi:MAG TPA: DUF21 domain-containing protein [Candidatus Melainabacteria bacterium]|nr:DUF21 domain-containing protein [Candidatus Melainabacteria bacterium]